MARVRCIFFSRHGTGSLDVLPHGRSTALASLTELYDLCPLPVESVGAVLEGRLHE